MRKRAAFSALFLIACVSDAPLVNEGGLPDGQMPVDTGTGSDGSMTGGDADSGPPDPTWTLPLDTTNLSFRGVSVDPMGNMYVVGSLNGAFSLDGLSIGSTQNNDVIVLKIDGATNKAVWIKTYGGPGNDQGLDIVYAMGALLIVGATDGSSVTFGSDTYMIPPSSFGATTNHSWFARIDPANGSAIWGRSPDWNRTPNTAHSSFCSSIAAHSTYFSIGCNYTGQYFGFGNNAANTSANAIAILRFQDSQNPQSTWTKSLIPSNSTSSAPRVAVDANDDTWVGAGYNGMGALQDFEKGTNVFASATGPTNLFALKITDSTQVVGPKQIWTGQNSGLLVPLVGRIAVGPTGAWVVGGTGGTSQFPGGQYVSKGSHDAYFLKLKGDLTYDWQQFVGGSASEIAVAAAIDSSNNVFTGFIYASSGLTFGNMLTDPPMPMAQAAIAKIDPTGKPIATKCIISKTGNVGMGSIAIANNLMYVVGTYGGDTTFDDGTQKLAPVNGSSYLLRRKLF